MHGNLLSFKLPLYIIFYRQFDHVYDIMVVQLQSSLNMMIKLVKHRLQKISEMGNCFALLIILREGSGRFYIELLSI